MTEHPDVVELLAAAETGPRPWRNGIREHLAAYPDHTHGRSCCTCRAYALGYHQLDWPLDEDLDKQR
ncbi:hypothetical protein ACIBKY_51110 [Nonomuraea sp. NPDC050394]|uniref:hypothetical protein n=1 Tax=Nonomuraea sp. NPDC050394 TaxID=3364363 RepID=UPI0037AF4351